MGIRQVIPHTYYPILPKTTKYNFSKNQSVEASSPVSIIIHIYIYIYICMFIYICFYFWKKSTNSSIRKRYLAVIVVEDQKRFVILIEYLGQHAFHVLVREANIANENTNSYSYIKRDTLLQEEWDSPVVPNEVMQIPALFKFF